MPPQAAGGFEDKHVSKGRGEGLSHCHLITKEGLPSWGQLLMAYTP